MKNEKSCPPSLTILVLPEALYMLTDSFKQRLLIARRTQEYSVEMYLYSTKRITRVCFNKGNEDCKGIKWQIAQRNTYNARTLDAKREGHFVYGPRLAAPWRFGITIKSDSTDWTRSYPMSDEQWCTRKNRAHYKTMLHTFIVNDAKIWACTTISCALHSTYERVGQADARTAITQVGAGRNAFPARHIQDVYRDPSRCPGISRRISRQRWRPIAHGKPWVLFR